jgi:glycosyltransferase involved in cell wall biosynthesis
MKIIFFRHSLLSRGGDKMIIMHASHLAAIGHQVTIKTNLVNSVFPLNHNVRIEPLRFSGKTGTLFSAIFERFDADFVIADIIPLACLLWFLNRHRTIYFAQDYDESYYSNLFQKLFIRGLYFLGLTLFRIRSISVAQPLAKLLINSYNAKVSVIENGVDATIFYTDPDPELITKKNGRKSLLLHSRRDHRKGFDIAVQTIEQLKSKQTVSYEIWTVGEAAHGLFPNLIHRDFGYVGETELRRIMSSADLFLYPTRHEGLPLMPLEAMATGCPVVVSAASHAIARHGFNSIVLFQEDPQRYAEEVCTLLSDHELRSRLIAGGLQTAAVHTLKNAQQQLGIILADWIAVE